MIKKEVIIKVETFIMETEMKNRTSYVTLGNNTIKYMLKYVDEYEQIKREEHKEFGTVAAFYKARKICHQNFSKFYARFIKCNRDPNALLPMRRGPKPKYLELPLADNSLEKKVLELREKGYNKFVISAAVKKEGFGKSSASSISRIMVKLGVSKLEKKMKEEKRTIIRTHPGSLVHVDCHVLPRAIVKEEPNKKLYVLGCIDTYSRVCWVEVTQSVKAIDACFAMMDILLIMNQRYSINFEEVLTDNGSEFCGGKVNKEEHPFERLLMHFAIKHRRTKPYCPQTNGKIERFWRSFDDEVIDGSEFDTIDDLKEAVLGYNLYYNEHRPHQALDGKIPVSLTNKEAA